MTVREIIERHPRPIGLDGDVLLRCIDECFDCSATCTSCADACLGESDVPDLVRHFFKQGESEGLRTKRISSGGIELMKRYPWPGNVRELENLIRRLAAPHRRIVHGPAAECQHQPG